MSYLKYGGQYVKTGGQFVGGFLPAIGALDFNGTYFVTLSEDPDLSFNKTITWKMWMDGSPSGDLFSLGVDEESLSIGASGTELRAYNKNRIMGTRGEKRLSVTGLTGMVLECTAIKTTNQILWFQVGGRASGDTGLGTVTSALDISRIGNTGLTGGPGVANNMFVWDLQVDGIAAWNGYSSANTDAGWVDTIGTSNGTINAGGSSVVELSSTPTYTDWFMPSKDELNAMYVNLKVEAVGGFRESPYWSSSETSTTEVWIQNFPDGAQLGTAAKTGLYFARACRSFTAGIGAYALRDTGPAGGLIFDIIGSTTYYEAAPSDNVYSFSGTSGLEWSNVTASASGATGTAVGTGITNTPLITGQASHFNSIADICEKFAVL